MTENIVNELERRVELGLLMDLYSPLLSERIADIMNMYVLEDYGLSEIAQQKGISRQGVYDAVHRGEVQLLELEARLGLKKRYDAIAQAAQRCQEVLSGVIPAAGSEAALNEARDIVKSIRDM